MEPTPNVCLAAALQYAKRGLRVIPLNGIDDTGTCTCQPWRDQKSKGKCPTPGKHPKYGGWQESASTSAEALRRWFSRSTANVGIVTGARSAVFVLDVDPKSGGDDSLAALIAEYGKLPDTLQATTGSGGQHFYFKHPGGTIPNEVSIRPGLDIRGDGGQVVAPPSLHVSGRHYEWDGIAGFDAEIVSAPAWLLELVRPTKKPDGRATAFKLPRIVREGERNRVMFSYACALRAKGCDDTEVLEGMRAVNKPPRFASPLSEGEISTIAGSAAKYKPGKATNNGVAHTGGSEAADWRAHLILNRDGTPRPILANAITALRGAPEWAGVLGFNEFSLATVALKAAPWRAAKSGDWTDQEDRMTADWLQRQALIPAPLEIAGQAIQTVARERSFHPVRRYLESLKWDGTKRIDGWLSLYLGAESSGYTEGVGQRWLISAVARIYRPGAKADCCLVLEGPQGLGKSTALKTLGGNFFTDEIADLGSKDAAMQTIGVWIIEIAELDSMARGEVSKIKAFMSRSVDRFRPPYGARLVESPRQCVFAGSVNHATYLRDETGGRRFWPVRCTLIRLPELLRDRDQLWAEAVARFRAGAKWWLDSPELNQAAGARAGATLRGRSLG